MAEWTREEDEKMIRLNQDGLSAYDISLRMPDRSRSAILGRLFRLGIVSNKRTKKVSNLPIKPTRNLSAQAMARRSKPRTGNPPPFGEPTPLMVSLFDLEPRMCRWPYGEVGQKDFGFCGHKKDTSVPYCPYHQRAAHAERPLRKIARAA